MYVRIYVYIYYIHTHKIVCVFVLCCIHKVTTKHVDFETLVMPVISSCLLVITIVRSCVHASVCFRFICVYVFVCLFTITCLSSRPSLLYRSTTSTILLLLLLFPYTIASDLLCC